MIGLFLSLTITIWLNWSSNYNARNVCLSVHGVSISQFVGRMVDWSVRQFFLKLPYFSHFGSDLCQILKLKSEWQLKNFIFGRPSWNLEDILDLLKLPYFSIFESDWCQILHLSLVGVKDVTKLKKFSGHLGFWKPSWIFLKWPYISHFRWYWCQILNLSLVGVKEVTQMKNFKCWRPSWIF